MSETETRADTLIWSAEHRAWWRPEGAGYTRDVMFAGLWTAEEATRKTSHCGPEKQIKLVPAQKVDPDFARRGRISRVSHRPGGMMDGADAVVVRIGGAAHYLSVEDARNLAADIEEVAYKTLPVTIGLASQEDGGQIAAAWQKLERGGRLSWLLPKIPTDDPSTRLYPEEDWHEEDGPVLWHHFDEWGSLCEAPIVSEGGGSLESKQPWRGYYSHWSRLPRLPYFPVRSLMIAPPGTLICD